MNTAIIMLGSNTNATENMELVLNRLIVCFEIIGISSQLNTEPYGQGFSDNFHNRAIKLISNETMDKTIAIFKQIEVDMGREYRSKLSGIIPIDIDLIFWNDILVRDDYNRFEYVRNCVNEIR
ncbi:MAG: 2-amino-4-hydroxy-6-hydroxymethyldihydropteridine diphosphokinase [Bacteroidota bacterium]|nr:2-amino-4-hydroxy-6-hydroxymethyldihydropteridine diphosphokinase [Bacteroidota bacterium]